MLPYFGFDCLNKRQQFSTSGPCLPKNVAFVLNKKLLKLKPTINRIVSLRLERQMTWSSGDKLGYSTKNIGHKTPHLNDNEENDNEIYFQTGHTGFRLVVWRQNSFLFTSKLYGTFYTTSYPSSFTEKDWEEENKMADKMNDIKVFLIAISEHSDIYYIRF